MADIFDTLDNKQSQGDIFDQIYVDPKVGFFGKVPLSKYQAGERNIVGNIFERPASALRGLIQALPPGGETPMQGYQKGALNPAKVPNFQDIALDKYYGKSGKKPSVGKVAGGFGVSTAGLGADILTNPANLLMMLVGKTPMGGGKSLSGVISKTAPAKTFNKFVNTPIEEFGVSKTLISNKGGIVPFQTMTGKMDKVIDTSINKAIRPTVVGKSTSTQVSNYYNKARQAVQAIYNNKENLVFEDATHPMGYVNKLPESLNEFSSAVEQTKQGVFNQYNALAKQAGQEGVTIPLNNVSRELNIVAGNKVLQDIRPEVTKYASEQAARFAKRGNYTPEEAQQAIKIYNQSLEAFYKNPTPDTASKAVIDSGIANNLRTALDDSISNMPERLPSDSVVNPSYKQLKNTYAALKAIEKDVNRRAIVDARKNVKGLIDFTDVFSGGQMMKGILTLNPQEFATGLGQKIIASYIKARNNPNTMIKNMFRLVDRVNTRKVVKP